jgi:hypothetical protein
VIVLALFNLVDAVIIDWLVLLVLWPGLGVLPGTEGMAGYKDARRRFAKFCAVRSSHLAKPPRS